MGRRGDGSSGPRNRKYTCVHLHDWKWRPRMFSSEGSSGGGAGWGGPPLQCQSGPSIAAKKRVNRRKTQIRDKTIEKYTSISSDGGSTRGWGLWLSAVLRGMWRSQGGAALFLMGLSHQPGDQDNRRRKNLKPKGEKNKTQIGSCFYLRIQRFSTQFHRL